MQEQSGVVRSQNGLMTSSIQKSIILKEQPDRKEVLKNLVYLLNRIAKLYQIPNFYNENAVLLASWIFDTYKYDQFESIEKALTNPGPLDEKSQRLTPDIIAQWIAIELDRVASKVETEHQNNKTKTIELTVNNDTELSDETKDMIQDYLNSLSGPKMVQALTDEDILKYGKERLKPKSLSVGHNTTDREYLIEKELRRKWMQEVFDPITGKQNENYLSFEEWKMM